MNIIVENKLTICNIFFATFNMKNTAVILFRFSVSTKFGKWLEIQIYDRHKSESRLRKTFVFVTTNQFFSDWEQTWRRALSASVAIVFLSSYAFCQ